MIATILSAFLLLLLPRTAFPIWMAPRLTGTGALFFILLLIAAHAIVISDADPRIKNKKEHALRRLHHYITFGFLLGFWGGLGGFQLDAPVDKMVHVALGVLAGISVTLLLRHWYDTRIERAALFAAVGIGCLAILWELLELLTDTILKTKTMGTPTGQSPRLDTMVDLICSFAGVLWGLALALYFEKNGKTKTELQ